MGSVMAPRDVSIGPGNVILFGESVFAEVTEVRTSRRGHPGLGPSPTTSVPVRGRQREMVGEEKKAL